MGETPTVSGGSQTVTFLFTDIESSTQRWDVDGAGMSTALAEHDTAMRSTIAAHRGETFKHTGDGVCAVFRSAADAAHAALDAQQRVGLPVRMGVVRRIRDGFQTLGDQRSSAD